MVVEVGTAFCGKWGDVSEEGACVARVRGTCDGHALCWCGHLRGISVHLATKLARMSGDGQVGPVAVTRFSQTVCENVTVARKCLL